MRTEALPWEHEKKPERGKDRDGRDTFQEHLRENYRAKVSKVKTKTFKGR